MRYFKTQSAGDSMQKNSNYILVLYYSRNHSTKHLAEEIAHGIESANTPLQARLRTGP